MCSDAELVNWIQFHDYGVLNRRNNPSIVLLYKQSLNQSTFQSFCLFKNILFILLEYKDQLKDVWPCIDSLNHYYYYPMARYCQCGDSPHRTLGINPFATTIDGMTRCLIFEVERIFSKKHKWRSMTECEWIICKNGFWEKNLNK